MPTKEEKLKEDGTFVEKPAISQSGDNVVLSREMFNELVSRIDSAKSSENEPISLLGSNVKKEHTAVVMKHDGKYVVWAGNQKKLSKDGRQMLIMDVKTHDGDLYTSVNTNDFLLYNEREVCTIIPEKSKKKQVITHNGETVIPRVVDEGKTTYRTISNKPVRLEAKRIETTYVLKTKDGLEIEVPENYLNLSGGVNVSKEETIIE